MRLLLETTTGLLQPVGVAPPLLRGADKILLQFLTNGVAGLLAGGTPIALKLTNPSDAAFAAPIANVNAWTAVPGDLNYTATLDTLGVADLAWVLEKVLLGRIEYGAGPTLSQAFHVNYGGGSGLVGTTPQIVISQPTGPVNYVQPIGRFTGRLVVGQTEGFWRVKSPCNLLGLQLGAQEAPTGANALVDVVKGGVAQNKIATLTAGQKVEETVFGAPLALAIGDIIQFRPTQVGAGRPGTDLDVKGILQLL